jgi:hypothetical protein
MEADVSNGEATKGPIDDRQAKLESALRRPRVASELFFPLELALWCDGRYRVPRSKAGEVRSTTGGVRLHASDPAAAGTPTDAECQSDVVRLVEAIREIRNEPALSGAVLSPDSVDGKQQGKRAGRRVKFGLYVPKDERFREAVSAARETHKRLVGAIHRAGFAVAEPAERFDAKTGLEGLSLWGSRLRLRRRRRDLPLIIAAFLAAALLALLWLVCRDRPILIDQTIETKSLIIVLDESSSMGNAFPIVREKAKRYLEGRKSSWLHTYYIDCIKYDDTARSALGSIRKVDDATISNVDRFLNEPPHSGGTKLAAALEEAAREVAKHKLPTTLVILTDGEDNSVPMINQDIQAWKARFDGTAVKVNTMTPRLLTPGADPRPAGTYEQELAKLSENFDGKFGPDK